MNIYNSKELIEFINENMFDCTGRLNPYRMSKNYFEKIKKEHIFDHFTELKNYHNFNSFGEVFYHLINDSPKIKCSECGSSKVKFRSFK